MASCNNAADCANARSGTFSFIILLLAVFAAGTASAATNLTGCAQIDVSGDYVLTANVTDYNGTCFIFNANYINLNGNGNTIDGIDKLGTYGAYFQNSFYSNISNLKITDFGSGFLFDPVGSGFNAIKNSEAGSCEYGFHVYSSYNNITNCSATSNRWGIYIYGGLDGAGYNIVRNTRVSYNSDNGLWIQHAEGNRITNVTAQYNSEGFFLFANGDNNLLENCTADNNYGTGFGIRDTMGNNITDSTSRGNSGDAIYVRGSTGCRITNSAFLNSNRALNITADSNGNTFINNIFNGTYDVSGTGNTFNGSLLNATNIVGNARMGGNYWADGVGAGYSDLCPSTFGICTSPYIAGNIQDYLPLAGNYTVVIGTINITLNSPQNGIYLRNSTVRFNWSVAAASAVTCNLTRNGTNIAVKICPGNATCGSVNTTADGNWNWSVKCWDNTTIGSSTTRNFIMDTAPPALAIVRPLNTTYNTTTLALEFTAAGAANCWYYLNGGFVRYTLPGCANTTITATVGRNNITVFANDTAGNLNSTTMEFRVQLPNVSVTLNYPWGGAYLNTNSILFNWSVAAPAGVSCTLYRNGTALTTMACPGNSTPCTFLNAAPDGFWNWNVSCLMNATRGLSAVNNFIVDTIPPALAMNSPLNMTYDSTAVALNFTTDGTDCWYSLNSGENTPLFGCENATLAASMGNNTLRLYATDWAGNVNNINRTFAVQAPNASIIIITLNWPAAGVYTNSNTVSFNWSVAASAAVSCNLTVNGTTFASKACPGDSTCASANFTADGFWVWNVACWNNLTSRNAINRNLTVDTVPPALSVTYPLNASYNSPSSSFALNFIAGGAANCWYSLNGGANTTLPGCANTTMTVVPGRNNLSLYASDLAGNANSANRSFTLNPMPRPSNMRTSR
jgi:parallel beta-helix repeat protein